MVRRQTVPIQLSSAVARMYARRVISVWSVLSRRVLSLPAFKHVQTFAAEQLQKPYGLWINKAGNGYQVYVTDAYMAGEDAQGEDILPPLDQLDKRVWRFDVARNGDALSASAGGSFGDASPEGALRVVESIWGDAANDRHQGVEYQGDPQYAALVGVLGFVMATTITHRDVLLLRFWGRVSIRALTAC